MIETALFIQSIQNLKQNLSSTLQKKKEKNEKVLPTNPIFRPGDPKQLLAFVR